MLALGWIFGVTLLLTLQENSLALPTAGLQSAITEHVRNAAVIDGQPLAPCVNDICPLLAAVVPESLPKPTSNATIPETLVGNMTKVGDARPGKHVDDDDSDVPANCSSSTEPEARHFRSAFKVSGANQTVPPSCLNGKVRCLLQANTTEFPSQYSAKKHNSSSENPACRANRTSSHFPGTRQTAPINCGDGTKPPCGKGHLNKDPGHHSSNETISHFPGTHQTAPINCGDGTKPPCGKTHSSEGTHFPGTHQTAPINCGDGTKPPCGKTHPSEGTRFPGTHQTAPIHCGDGTKPPCGKHALPSETGSSSNETSTSLHPSTPA